MWPEIAVKAALTGYGFSTGDELTSVGKPLAPGEFMTAIATAARSLLTRLGLTLSTWGQCQITQARLKRLCYDITEWQMQSLSTGIGVPVGETRIL